jgi:hypothetical protein
LCGLIGCTSTQIPVYLKDRKPSAQRFYADHQRVVAASKQALTDLGWMIENEMEPQVFEVDPERQVKESILLVTEIRETRFFLGTRYARMNIFVNSSGEVSEVEMRYVVISDVAFLKSKAYGNRKIASRFFELVKKNLGE